MEMQNVSLRGIKVDPLAHELAASERTQPYLDCLIRAYPLNSPRLRRDSSDRSLPTDANLSHLLAETGPFKRVLLAGWGY
jgi:hypothetical protein